MAKNESVSNQERISEQLRKRKFAKEKDLQEEKLEGKRKYNPKKICP